MLRTTTMLRPVFGPLLMVILCACNPSIQGITPPNAKVGETVTISGLNFGNVQGSSTVSFNGVDAGVALSWANNLIEVAVPEGAQSGPVTVTVAGRTSNAWDFIVLEVIAVGCQYPSLALGPLEEPHVSCYDPVGKDLYYHVRSGGTGWVSEAVDTEGDKGRYHSLAVDPFGTPHIGYTDRTTWSVKYASRTDSGWQREIIDQAWGFGELISWTPGLGTSLALNVSGQPRIAYVGCIWASPGYFPTYVVKYAGWSGTAWNVESVFNGGYYTDVLGISLAVDTYDIPKIAHGKAYVTINEYSGALYYTDKVGGSWSTQIVANWSMFPEAHAPGYHPSIALDSAGSPHISHYDASADRLVYAHKEGGLWVSEEVDTSLGDGTNSSIAIASPGQPAICYEDLGNNDLKLAVQRPEGGWDISTLVSQGNTGKTPSLRLASGDKLRVVFYDEGEGELIYFAQP